MKPLSRLTASIAFTRPRRAGPS